MYYEGKTETVNCLQDYIQVILKNTENNFLKSDLNYNDCIEARVLDQIIHEIRLHGDSVIRFSDEIYISADNAIKNIENIKKTYVSQRKSGYPKCKLFYRGQSKLDYKLLPSIWRDNGLAENIRFENYYFRQIEVLCPDEFRSKNHLEHLTMMQHYGCPTRLLDVTTNPLVALYFACKSRRDNQNPGKISIFAPRETDVLSFDSDKAMLLACLATFSKDEKDRIYEECIKKLKNKQLFSGKCIKEIEKLAHEAQRDKSGFELKIDPLNLLTPYFVQPLHDNRRIDKQNGAFIICGLNNSPLHAEELLRELEVKEIIVENKKQILDELDRMGINQATLFPEVEKVAEYLVNSKKVEWSYNAQDKSHNQARQNQKNHELLSAVGINSK